MCLLAQCVALATFFAMGYTAQGRSCIILANGNIVVPSWERVVSNMTVKSDREEPVTKVRTVPIRAWRFGKARMARPIALQEDYS